MPNNINRRSGVFRHSNLFSSLRNEYEEAIQILAAEQLELRIRMEEEERYRQIVSQQPSPQNGWVTYGSLNFEELVKPRKKKRSHLPKWW